jgi:hypothetical protein
VAQAYERVRMTKRAKKSKRAKEVEPNDHSEATHIHELYPHKLAFGSSMMVAP